jgi:hypothetical protein
VSIARALSNDTSDIKLRFPLAEMVQQLPGAPRCGSEKARITPGFFLAAALR